MNIAPEDQASRQTPFTTDIPNPHNHIQTSENVSAPSSAITKPETRSPYPPRVPPRPNNLGTQSAAFYAARGELYPWHPTPKSKPIAATPNNPPVPAPRRAKPPLVRMPSATASAPAFL